MAIRVICICNQKGGVNKTTIAVNLATSLANKGHKTLLIDIDSQGNASQNLGITSFDSGTANLFEDSKVMIKDTINPTKIMNLSIIPSDLSLSQVEWDLLKKFKQNNVSILRDKMEMIKEDFNYCVIDCPPSLGLFTLNALIASDRVLVPIIIDPFAVIGTKYLNMVVDDIRMNTNKKLKMLGIIRTMWDMRLILGKEIGQNLEQDYSGKLFKTIIQTSVRVKESCVAQIPIVNYEPTCPISMQYNELTEEVLAKW